VDADNLAAIFKGHTRKLNNIKFLIIIFFMYITLSFTIYTDYNLQYFLLMYKKLVLVN